MTTTYHTAIAANAPAVAATFNSPLGELDSAIGTLAAAVQSLSFACIVDEKEYSANGGASTTTWDTRDLNTEYYDPDGIVSVASNQFTLAAGSYIIEWSAPAFGATTYRHVTRLYDITGAAVIRYGTTVLTITVNETEPIQATSTGCAFVSIASNNVYEIQDKAWGAEATWGWGNSSAFSDAVSIFTIVKIIKIG